MHPIAKSLQRWDWPRLIQNGNLYKGAIGLALVWLPSVLGVLPTGQDQQGKQAEMSLTVSISSTITEATPVGLPTSWHCLRPTFS